MVAETGRELASSLSLAEALWPAGRDGPARRSADPAASGECFDGEGPAALGGFLVVERDFLRSAARRAAARNKNVQGAGRGRISPAVHHGQRLSTSGNAPVSPPHRPACLRRSPPAGSRPRPAGGPVGLARYAGRRSH